MKTLTVIIGITVPTFIAGLAALPPDYQGRPFDDAAYRAEHQAVTFTPELVLWDSKAAAHDSGWIGKGETNATLVLDPADNEGKRLIHYHNAGNGNFSIFGWKWAVPHGKPVDLRQYDAISFAIKITGPKKLQELYFGITRDDPTPVFLRKYDPQFADGNWHQITIPIRDLKWSPYMPVTDVTEARGCVFMTRLWQNSDYEIYLDHLTCDRISAPLGQEIPGRLQCAFYDLGGEGVAYHDTDAINILSGILNQQKGHQRPQATSYEWNFRKEEGVDISFTKDTADFSHAPNHPNLVAPMTNQLYIGGTEDGEWCNYTVNVKTAGTYRIIAMYGYQTNRFSFSLNHKPASECQFPVDTGSFHIWNKAEVGQMTFPETGQQLLTLHYTKGNNLAYFDFELAAEKK